MTGQRSEMKKATQAMIADVDPITTEIIRHTLNSVAEQMKRTLIRTAFSPVIYEVLDFAVSIYDRQVRLLAQAPTLPIFMGTLSFCVEAAVKGVGGEKALEPGDILYINLPYATGTHPQDAALIMPVFAGGDELIGYAAVKAHLLDVGGKEPYSTDTVDLFQEGTIFPGVKLYRRGERVLDIYRTLLANSRMPTAIGGDVEAMVASLRVGAVGLRDVVERYGGERFSGSVERMLDHGEALVRSYLQEIPDGRYSAFGRMDSDGIRDEEIEFEVIVEIAGSSVTVDYSNAPEARGGPINCPRPDTVSATSVAIMMLAGSGDQPNQGHFRPIEVITRPGSMFEPLPPSPCFLVGWATLQAMEVIYKALATALPERVPASSGGCILTVVPWGLRSGTREPWADAFICPVGQGAHAAGDGANSLMHISETSTRFPSAEVWEARNPWLFEKVELAQDSGGAGRYRGGLGLDISFRALEDSWVTSVIERTKNPPWGLAGGDTGRPNRAVLRLPDGRTKEIGKATRVEVPKDAIFEIQCGGGGGYGPASEREAEAVRVDVREGYISDGHARRHYGHVLPA
ncbi:hydantoinase B/oxoprolinase family protein [Mesorhizobium sp.]|uniref:hydantoinase B/oxoprolinase family protein n=1 Tax=Mesorhizobium sp. TaxID=1871066 RepID=UPI0025C49809|nr:hydantoinase B/oxoprolinase family protein [Mesorhizobium sp.]